MDVEPLFCAEQIVVPNGLSQILKAFAKEAIRRSPQDLLQFSAAYFTHLAEAASSEWKKGKGKWGWPSEMKRERERCVCASQ